jgi:hypothetical protein
VAERLKPIVGGALRALAAGLLVSLVIACCHDVSKAWDVWYYHLPFAGRLVGLVDPATYAFGRANQARFEGFPLFGELLQGLCWRITGRIECASLVSFAALPAFAWFMRRAFDVPLHLTLLSLLAIPLVQIHATGCYVDLPANAWVTMLVLVAFRSVVSKEPPSLRALLIAGALAIAAANTKFQLVPVVMAAALVLVVVSLRRDPKRRLRVLMIALALPLVLATPLKNVARHGNPVWPVEVSLLGHALPHSEGAYSSSPVWLENAPRPLRWGASVLELGLQPITSHARWSIDQWTPPSEPGYRMGGFFGAYVVVNIAALGLALYRRRNRETKAAALFAGGATVIASSMPQSHELRYYLFWMLLLVALNLVVWSRERPLTSGLVALGALVIVSWSTRGTYLYASGDSFRELVAAKVDNAALERIAPNERVCVTREPWTFLYAPRFHSERPFVVQEAETAAECAGAPLLE